ncbi:MAG: HIT family protein [Dehalococcoidales bacterium]|nr:MAG: HIT family protein [Dehalococcoidales bacterium]
MSDCVFCDIVAGTAPASIVYQDDVVIAFMDIRPVNPGHLVVIPREHSTSLAEMDEETGMYLFSVTMRLAQAVRDSGVKCEGINLFVADGEAAGQEIFHLHILVFPRFKNDSFRVNVDWSVQPSRDELDEIAARISRAYQSLA